MYNAMPIELVADMPAMQKTADLHELMTAPQACVTLNANLPEAEFMSGLQDTLHIAADGAAQHLLDRGIVPDYVVGDMDSITPGTRTLLASILGSYSKTPPADLAAESSDRAHEGLAAAERIVYDTDQESNDFEKCLRHCQKLGLSRIMVLGIHGGQLEHTLNNWSVLMRFAQEMELCVYDAGRFAVPVFDVLHLPTRPGEVISFIPQPAARITSMGVEWPLTREELRMGHREGARNLASGNLVSLTVHSGSVLTFCNADMNRFDSSLLP